MNGGRKEGEETCLPERKASCCKGSDGREKREAGADEECRDIGKILRCEFTTVIDINL